MSKATKIGPHGELLNPLTGLPIPVVGARPPLQRTNASGAVPPNNAMSLPYNGPLTPAHTYKGATKIGPHGELLNPLTGLPINASGAVPPTIENITNDVKALQTMVENKSKSLPPTFYERIRYALMDLEMALVQAVVKFHGGKHRSRRHHKSRHHKSRRHTRRS
jgi:hypothetical protein